MMLIKLKLNVGYLVLSTKLEAGRGCVFLASLCTCSKTGLLARDRATRAPTKTLCSTGGKTQSTGWRLREIGAPLLRQTTARWTVLKHSLSYTDAVFWALFIIFLSIWIDSGHSTFFYGYLTLKLCFVPARSCVYIEYYFFNPPSTAVLLAWSFASLCLEEQFCFRFEEAVCHKHNYLRFIVPAKLLMHQNWFDLMYHPQRQSTERVEKSFWTKCNMMPLMCLVPQIEFKHSLDLLFHVWGLLYHTDRSTFILSLA